MCNLALWLHCTPIIVWPLILSNADDDESRESDMWKCAVLVWVQFNGNILISCCCISFSSALVVLHVKQRRRQRQLGFCRTAPEFGGHSGENHWSVFYSDVGDSQHGRTAAYRRCCWRQNDQRRSVSPCFRPLCGVATLSCNLDNSGEIRRQS